MKSKRIITLLCAFTLLISVPVSAEQKNQSSILDIACEPTDIILISDNTYLVTDTYYKVVLQVKDGTTSLYAGSPTRAGLYGEPVGGYRDSDSDSSTFRKPWAITPFGNGYAVTDTNNSSIRFVTDIVTKTIANGEITNLRDVIEQTSWSRPTGLVTDDNGDLYVADTGNNRICRIDHTNGNVSIICDELTEPTGLSWYDDCLYIAETRRNRILKWDKTTNELSVIAGSGEASYADGDAAEAAFAWPLGVEAAPDGTVFIADSGNCAIRMLKDDVVTTLLIADLDALDQYPSHPQGMLYSDGTLYVCDSYANKIYTIEVEK